MSLQLLRGGIEYACVCRCDGDVVCVDHDLNRYSWWWYVCSVYFGIVYSVGERTPPSTPYLAVCLCEVLLSMSLLGFGVGTMLANFHV